MIVGHDPDNINKYYEIGAVIISYNGSVIHNMDDYDTAKENRPEKGTVAVEVLRRNNSDEWERVRLNIPTNAPGVYMAQMTEKEYD